MKFYGLFICQGKEMRYSLYAEDAKAADQRFLKLATDYGWKYQGLEFQ